MGPWARDRSSTRCGLRVTSSSSQICLLRGIFPYRRSDRRRPWRRIAILPNLIVLAVDDRHHLRAGVIEDHDIIRIGRNHWCMIETSRVTSSDIVLRYVVTARGDPKADPLEVDGDVACPDVIEFDSIAPRSCFGNHRAVGLTRERRFNAKRARSPEVIADDFDGFPAGTDGREAVLASDCVRIDDEDSFITGLGRKSALPRTVRAGDHD